MDKIFIFAVVNFRFFFLKQKMPLALILEICLVLDMKISHF